MPTFYTPQTGPTGGFRIGEALAAGYRDRSDLDNASQLRRIREEEAARARAQEIDAAESRRIKGIGERIALRGQLIGAGETADDYLAVLPMLKQYGLPTDDLPELRSTASETFRARPEAPTTAPAWMPKAQPAWMPSFETNLPAPEATPRDLPQGSMVDPADLQAVQRRAQMGLPLDKQEKFKDADIGRQIQLQTLSRNLDKDALSREWMSFQREAKIQGMTEAETDRAFKRRIAELGYNIDLAKLDLETKKTTATLTGAKTGTEGQAKAGLFGSGIEAARGTLERLMDEGHDPTAITSGLRNWVAGTPLRGLTSANDQLWAQAVNEISNNALRYKSGAAIGEKEAGREIEQNIPQPGDRPEVVRAKLATIKRIEDGLADAAGPANWRNKPGGTTPASSGDAPPVSALREGKWIKFPNGQTWTLKNGKPERVK